MGGDQGGGSACTLMGLDLGLGDSTDDAVQDSKILWKDQKDKAGGDLRFPDKSDRQCTGTLKPFTHGIKTIGVSGECRRWSQVANGSTDGFQTQVQHSAVSQRQHRF